ncbi:hypothetical protein F889_01528 [Acinetobacter colistiniresistens]|uniref:Uncharacterized protein n=1 Tax=Acinetobacter colistiniresistens TaxID=280145 RepID=N9PN13_9GAMM|nr:hypothetical protein [Acinetobacter colistiniresistens]ENX34888.1 hypothetical protein F889_01528 [Acinetobacter colistiniresistens]
MPAVLEIFNRDGSLRFSSERYKILKYDGEYNALESMKIVTNGDWSSRWQVDLGIRIPAAKGSRGLAYIPWLFLVQPQRNQEYIRTLTRVLYFPNNINRAQLWEHVSQPAFTVSM